MRIIAGRFKGFELSTPRLGTRPTTDRVKEAIFSHLDHIGALDGGAVLDLYAGTGALGIEALSRGADSVTMIDMANGAIRLLRQAAIRIQHHSQWTHNYAVEVLQQKAEQFIASRPKYEAQDSIPRYADAPNGYAIIFIDPPYAVSDEECNALLAQLVHTDCVSQGTVIVLERSARSATPEIPEHWELSTAKSYGETAIYYIQYE